MLGQPVGGGGTHMRPAAPRLVLAQTSPHIPPKYICSSVPSAWGAAGGESPRFCWQG